MGTLQQQFLAPTCFSGEVGVRGFNGTRSFGLAFSNGYSSLSPFPHRKISLSLRKWSIVAAKKGNYSNKKFDSHSFVPKPDEATGFFPEAVLLKEKKVQEDGRLLPEFADAEEQELFERLNLELESDIDLERMRHYEVVYLIHEDHVQEVENVNSKVREFLKEKRGKVWRFSDWGLRRLAYKIKKAKNAHYILMNFELDAKWINDFKSMLDKDERVIRHLVMKRDKAETVECPPPPVFHTFRADMHDGVEDDVDDDDDDDDDIDAAYDDEDDGGDWEEKGEEEAAGNMNGIENGIIYVEEDVDDCMVSKNTKQQTTASRSGRQGQGSKAGR